MKIKFKILSINISDKKGIEKKPVGEADLKIDHGIMGDAHAGNWHRQISMLAVEDINKMRALGLELDYGDFAENITTEGIELASLPIGTKIELGDSIVEVTQIGKECHHHCSIYQRAGDCIMPRKGIFVKVLHNGHIKKGTLCSTL
ncbi:MAG: MOSC domain-containing protein [Spirochaetaceae bacterium]|jgi:MOSC domain-containing protein YiiM|nr:MOSC domain-containing protein [Spirochaetaceae bacterium]